MRKKNNNEKEVLQAISHGLQKVEDPLIMSNKIQSIDSFETSIDMIVGDKANLENLQSTKVKLKDKLDCSGEFVMQKENYADFEL